MKKDNPENNHELANQADVSRRSFIKMAGLGMGIGLVGGVAGCDGKPTGGGGWVPTQFEGKGFFPAQVRGRVPIDPSNPSICRDDSLCILCGQCAAVCEKFEAVHGHYQLPMVDDVPCVHCGQCTLWCPTGAIAENSGIAKMTQALENPDLHVVVQFAPSTRVGLGEEFGMPVGTNVEGLQIAALRALGVNTVFDTNFAADMTIVEEATELVSRISGKIKAPIPMFTSCCPGWVKFCEYFHPDLIPNLSTARSPMGMLSPMIKTYYAKQKNIEANKIFSVAIMPCTAKKFEASRPEMNNAGRYHGDESIRDTDLVLTTRELAKLLKTKGIDLPKLTPSTCDTMMSEYSGGGAIFGVTGGVMEAAVRSGYYYITNEAPPELLYDLEPIRGLKGIKSAELDVPTVGKVRIAVVSGLDNANELIKRVKDGSELFHFIEVMACPGGCISGGGQPKSSIPPNDKDRAARTNALYSIDERLTLRLCHENPELKAMYKDFLDDEPNGHIAHALLHTHTASEETPKHGYHDRSMNLVAKK